MGQRRTNEGMSPDEVASRAFPSAFRGVSETDVRSYLRRVADELRSVKDREAELAQRVAELEAALRDPQPLDEQQLLDALGEETARVLRSAQGAAEEIRTRAESRASELVREAQEEASKVRAAADRVLSERTSAAAAAAADTVRDADERAKGMVAVADERAARIVNNAEDDARRVREEAQQMAAAERDAQAEAGRMLVAEAEAERDRIVAELTERRDTLSAQVAEMHRGREHLIEAFRTVKRAYSDAVGALAKLEKAASATPAPPVAESSIDIPLDGPVPAPHARASEPETTPTTVKPADTAAAPVEVSTGADRPTPVEVTTPGNQPVIEPVASNVPTPIPEAAAETLAPVIALNPRGATPPAIDDGSTDVDALFARLRAEHPDDPTSEDVDGAATGEGEAAPDPLDGGVAVVVTETVVETIVVTEAVEIDLTAPAVADTSLSDDAEGDTPAGSDDDGDAAADAAAIELQGDARIIAERDAGIEPSIAALARGIKRGLQDEQNEVLDSVRKQKRKLSVEKSLPELDDHRRAWSDVLDAPVRAAFTAGAASVDASKAAMPDDLVATLADWVMLPLRERLVATIAESVAPGADLDTSDLPARIGARYREFRNQDLDGAVLEVLGAAYARGVAAGVPAGTLLRWVPTTPGTCSDCDDNVLEPTVAGVAFPTGQAWPPAHPGCRCALVPANRDDAPALAGAKRRGQ